MASSISLGGKGSSLSSSSVYKVSTGVAQVKIDSSALGRLFTKNKNPIISPKKSLSLAIPQDLTIEELRASLAVLLHKLLLSPSSSTKIRTSLPVKISESLNTKSNSEAEALDFVEISESLNLKSEKEALEFSEIDLTEGECDVLENSCASLIGICSVIEHKSSALSRIVDAVAALSCEALKADVTSFSSLDSEEKDAIAVARDLKVLLNGSNLLVGEEIEAVSKIPKIHGTFRDAVKNLGGVVKVELNSEKFGCGTKEALGTRLLALSMAIKNMAECSLKRAKLCFESIEDEESMNGLESWFSLQTWCLDNDGLGLEDAYKVANNALVVDEDYCKFAHLVNESLGILHKIFAFEALVASFNLKGEELYNEKPKKKDEEGKVVLGKGTSILVQYMKDRLLCEDLVHLEQRAKKIASWSLYLLNPEDPVFTCFLDKEKEIVESNEQKRLRKVNMSLLVFLVGLTASMLILLL